MLSPEEKEVNVADDPLYKEAIRVLEITRTHDEQKRIIGLQGSIIDGLQGELAVAQLQIAQLSETSKGFDAMKEDHDMIAAWMRDNCAKQIERGYHSGRSLGVITVGYLNQLRDAQTAGVHATNLSWFHAQQMNKVPAWLKFVLRIKAYVEK